MFPLPSSIDHNEQHDLEGDVEELLASSSHLDDWPIITADFLSIKQSSKLTMSPSLSPRCTPSAPLHATHSHVIYMVSARRNVVGVMAAVTTLLNQSIACVLCKRWIRFRPIMKLHFAAAQHSRPFGNSWVSAHTRSWLYQQMSLR
jgi:hypothetical protein